MFAKSPNSDSYDYFLKGDDGELHRVGWATSDSVKFDVSDDKVIPSLNEPCEFSATVEVNPDFTKQMTEEIRQDVQKSIVILNQVRSAIISCVYLDGDCYGCPFQGEKDCRQKLSRLAIDAITQYRKVYEQILPKEE